MSGWSINFGKVGKLGRRRRKVVKVPRKVLPRIYSCPKCGEDSIRVVISRDANTAKVSCGNEKCRILAEVPVAKVEQPVDAYCKFTDLFHSGKLV